MSCSPLVLRTTALFATSASHFSQQVYARREHVAAQTARAAAPPHAFAGTHTETAYGALSIYRFTFVTRRAGRDSAQKHRLALFERNRLHSSCTAAARRQHSVCPRLGKRPNARLFKKRQRTVQPLEPPQQPTLAHREPSSLRPRGQPHPAQVCARRQNGRGKVPRDVRPRVQLLLQLGLVVQGAQHVGHRGGPEGVLVGRQRRRRGRGRVAGHVHRDLLHRVLQPRARGDSVRRRPLLRILRRLQAPQGVPPLPARGPLRVLVPGRKETCGWRPERHGLHPRVHGPRRGDRGHAPGTLPANLRYVQLYYLPIVLFSRLHY